MTLTKSKNSRKNTTEQVILTREIGKNIPTLIAGLAASSKVASIEELIANSYDSDATQVDVIYDQNELIISDNGQGMSPEQLYHFFRLGDSIKIEEKISPKGRMRMGKFGIATILIYDLGKEYFMETTQEGRTCLVHEQFGESISTDEDIPITVKPAEKSSHGTKITIRGLKIDNKNFSLNELERKLRWDFPLFVPDFKITLNAETLQPASIDAERRYEIPPNHYVDYVGTISGQFHYTARPNPNHGFHVYVNGRRVGNPKELFSGFFRGDIQSRIIGIIHANGLEDAILFDRGRFKEDHPSFTAFTNEVKILLRKIDGDIRRRSQKALQNNSAKNAKSIIRGVEDLINHKLKDEIGKSVALKVVPNSQMEDIRGQQDTRINLSSIYDGKGKIFIDESTPGLMISTSLDKASYHVHLLHRSIEGIVYRQLVDKLKKDHSTPFTIEEFLARKNELLAKFIGTDSQVALSSVRNNHSRKNINDAGISEIRRYSPSEISQLVGRPLGVINEMIKIGVMGELEEKEETVLGQNAISVLTKIQGYTSLYEIIHAISDSGMLEKKQTATYQSNFLKAIKDKNMNIAYFMNIGSNGKPCLFIMDEFAKEVKNVLSQTNLDLDEKLRKLAELDPMLTLPEIAKRLNTNLQNTASAVDYAVKTDMPLKIDKGDGEQGYKYRYVHVLQAYRKMQETKGE